MIDLGLADNDLLRNKLNQKYFLFDFETEGLNLRLTRPWQVAWLQAKGNFIVDVKNYYIKWKDLKVSKDAWRVTGFDPDKYAREAIDPEEVLNLFEPLLYNSDTISLGHNILGYDAYIHNNWRNLLGRKTDYSWLGNLLDTNCLEKSIELNIPPTPLQSRLVWQYRLGNIRKKGLKTGLEFLAKKYSIETDSSRLHQADYDVNINFQLFNKQKYMVNI